MSTLTATLPVPEVADPAAVTEPKTLTQEVFLNTLQAMAEHYKGGARTAFPLPLDFVPMVVEGGHLQAHAAPVANGKAQVDKILANGKAKLASFAKSQQTFVQKLTSQLPAKPKAADTANFAAQMEKERVSMKKQAADQIDQTIDALKVTGQDNPGLMSSILNIASSYASSVTAVLHTLTTFFTSIVPKVLAWIKSAANVIVKVAGEIESVGNVIENAFSWI